MLKLTSKEIVEKTFKKEKTERIPVNFRGFTAKVASYILKREAFVGGGIQQWREVKSLFEGWHDEYMERSFRDAVDVSLATNQDILRPEYWRYNVKPTRKIDENTYIFEQGKEEDWKILRYDPVSEQGAALPYKPKQVTVEDMKKNLKEYEREVAGYKPSEEEFSFQLKAQKLYGKEKVVEVGGVDIGIPFEAIDAWLEAMITDPEIVKAFLKLQVEISSKKIEFLTKLGFSYFMGGLDFASEQGPFFSPKLFKEILQPSLKEISEICHKFNGYFLFASDGNLWPVADGLFGESCIDGYFEVDRKAGMDLEKLRKGFPKLTLLGNISSWTLSQRGKEDVRKEVLSCLETARKYSGIVVGVSNYILPETPTENIDIMLETLEKNR